MARTGPIDEPNAAGTAAFLAALTATPRRIVEHDREHLEQFAATLDRRREGVP